MATMGLTAIGNEWTVPELDELPDDGNRYELVDGMLLVTPPPLIPHQVAAHLLANLMEPTAPPDLLVVPGPAQVTHGDRTSLEPDLSVVRRSEIRDGLLTAPPVLVVEILSRSTRSKDLVLKRSVYAEIGIPSYWIVDTSEPSVLILELNGDEYAERARAVGTESATVANPMPLTFSPAQLQIDLG